MGDTSSVFAVDPQIYEDIRETLAEARRKTCVAVNEAMVGAYWEIGRQIVEAQSERAEYGKQLIAYLAEKLTKEFGKGFTQRSLWQMKQFYRSFPKVHALRAELSWTHYRLLMRVPDEKRRMFYMNEAATERWSSRQLERQISTSYYERPLMSQDSGRKRVQQEIHTTTPLTKADDILKDPYVLEFLDIKEPESLQESDLEQALIAKLQEFMLELGKGFSFVARQKHVSDGMRHYYIDLVFYNYYMKCFVLIDLKTGRLTPQDVGQMDFYVRLYDDQYRLPEDNPPIGIILCAEKNVTVAKYSALADGKNLLASQYTTCLPTEDELAARVAYERELLENEICTTKLATEDDTPEG